MKSSKFSMVYLDGGNLLSSSLSGTVLALGRFIHTENNIVDIYRNIYLIFQLGLFIYTQLIIDKN